MLPLVGLVEELLGKGIGFRFFSDGGIDITTASRELISASFRAWRSSSDGLFLHLDWTLAGGVVEGTTQRLAVYRHHAYRKRSKSVTLCERSKEHGYEIRE